MRRILLILLSGLFLLLAGALAYAQWLQPIQEGWSELSDRPWFQATLADVCCGFVVFYCWFAYRERSWAARFLGLGALALTGNLAVTAYLIWRLAALSGDAFLVRLLLHPDDYERLCSGDRVSAP